MGERPDQPSDVRLLELCPPPDGAEDDVQIGEGGTTTSGASYRPLSHQAQFHDSLARYKLLLGGLGSGKTVAGIWEAFQRSVLMNSDRPHTGVIGALTYPHLRDIVVPVLEAIFGAPDTAACLAGGSWETAFSRSAMMLRLWNGTRILLRSLENGQYDKLRGIQFGWGYIDEASLLPDDQAWRVLIGRLRFPGVRYRGAWATTTPDGENWVWERFIAGSSELYDWIHATTYENVHLPQDYVHALEGDYSEDDRAQELLAQIVSKQGAVYKHLSHDIWPAGNVILMKPDLTVPCDLEIDFGYRSPRVHATQKHHLTHPKTRQVELVDVSIWELAGRNGRPPRDLLISEVVDQIQAAKLNVRRIFGDPSGDSANSLSHLTDVDHLRSAFKVGFISPQKTWQTSIENGERAVRARIKDGLGARRYLFAAKPGVLDEKGRPILYAKNQFQALRNLRYPDRTTEGPERGIAFKDGINDHDGDATRYHLVMEYGREWKRPPMEAVPI